MAAAENATQQPFVFDFDTHPSRYRHLRLAVSPDNPVAALSLDIQEDAGFRPGYALKLNSYDLGVDLELSDAVQRLRFEHPHVACVVITSAQPGIFSAGANIFMLGQSTHAFKVNFCKYTNETRLSIEDASLHSGQTYLAALNGTASGGGYELALACDRIVLVDDRRSAVSLPEVPYLGVLPGTGGLTRVADKRKVRRDRSDVFCSLAEGVKGKRAVEWRLVDAVYPSSRFTESVREEAQRLAGAGHPERRGITLESVAPEVNAQGLTYRHVAVRLGPIPRTARLTLTLPDALPELPAEPSALGSEWWPLRAFRELDDALCRLRFHYPDVGTILVETRGATDVALALDHGLEARRDDWFVSEVRHLIKRVLKRMDVTSKTFFALVDEGSCFIGTLLELALAADRIYVKDTDDVRLQLTPMNGGAYPMGNGLSRLASRFLYDPEHAHTLQERRAPVSASESEALGLATQAVDALDWDDELRILVEERASLSPDALTGMESNLRFCGPETMETKIFGRLSAWQNWIFQRPNAVGEHGALTLYGQPETAHYDYRRC